MASVRIACVHVPALPLQTLVQRHPDWLAHPTVVVDEDRPQGVVQWVNERARRCRILPGMRYAAALAASAALRAGTVSAEEVRAEVDRLLAALRPFSPAIEPCAEEPGVFWLDAAGLDRLFPDLRAWAEGVAAALAACGLRSVAVVVGFDRFCTYALAHARRGVTVLATPEEERAAADRVPLHRLRLEPELRDAMLRLGVRDVGAFRALHPAELAARFSREAAQAQREAAGTAPAPLVPRLPDEPIASRHDFEPGTHGIDANALLSVAAQHLLRLCAQLAARGAAAKALRLGLLLDRKPALEVVVRPATPTLDQQHLLELLRLRLESVTPGAEIEGFTLELEPAPAAHEQLQLFTTGKHRDLAAGNRALARLRARFGDDAVVTAALADGHLPEAQFRWQPCTGLRAARPRPTLVPRLVRRLLARPEVVAEQRPGEDGWFPSRAAHGPVHILQGPFVVNGGWWQRPVHRDYCFAHTRRGAVLWVFYDRVRRRWFAHGSVE